ncbi:hypothetical protein NDU88_006423 [Pleurodeles waltl]|uniref:Uncharacterized protein n=1 Tax=Pleurodeles waltl TaxID=8319 RepID=A0AAV7MC74_PLEWA|nr:hypothetical protein NDU88_006423 [Pleurodeles waltl]
MWLERTIQSIKTQLHIHRQAGQRIQTLHTLNRCSQEKRKKAGKSLVGKSQGCLRLGNLTATKAYPLFEHPQITKSDLSGGSAEDTVTKRYTQNNASKLVASHSLKKQALRSLDLHEFRNIQSATNHDLKLQTSATLGTLEQLREEPLTMPPIEQAVKAAEARDRHSNEQSVPHPSGVYQLEVRPRCK